MSLTSLVTHLALTASMCYATCFCAMLVDGVTDVRWGGLTWCLVVNAIDARSGCVDACAQSQVLGLETFALTVCLLAGSFFGEVQLGTIASGTFTWCFTDV